MGYLAVVIAWVVISWRVKRNKNVLDNLEKFPERDRIRIVRDEMGMPLHSELSPEQWIRTRTHRYFFLGFMITLLLILVIFLVSAFGKGKGTVSLDITTPEEVQPFGSPENNANGNAGANPNAEKPDGGPHRLSLTTQISTGKKVGTAVRYAYEHKGDTTVIHPEADFLTLRAKGGPIKDGVPGKMSSSFYMPSLSIKLVNNTSETVFLSEAVVKVTSSVKNLDPVLFVEAGEQPGEFFLYNEGWGPVTNPNLSFGFFDEANTCQDESWGTEEFNLTLPTFDVSQTGNVRKFFPSNLTSHLEARAGRRTICLFGTLKYTTANHQNRQLRLKLLIKVSGPDVFPYSSLLGEAAYNLVLIPGKSDYEVRVPMSQVIKPGEIDHFAINIKTTQSASFNFGISFRTTEGVEVSHKQVALDVFLPRSSGP